MAVEEGTIEVTTTGDKLDTAVVEQTDGTLAHREAVVLTDPEKLGHRANVLTRGPAPRRHDPANFQHDVGVSDYRLQVLEDVLNEILTEMKIMNLHLSCGSDEEINEGDLP